MMPRQAAGGTDMQWHGEEMNATRRSTMEDVHRIVPKLEGCPEYSYWSVRWSWRETNRRLPRNKAREKH